ncbi:hypothetical protein ABW21_db0201939 [Orbilia brochopaga]|nr:hypothetical protein ABW21_db0201939 [Drechslerella brochopaga]
MSACMLVSSSQPSGFRMAAATVKKASRVRCSNTSVDRTPSAFRILSWRSVSELSRDNVGYSSPSGKVDRSSMTTLTESASVGSSSPASLSRSFCTMPAELSTATTRAPRPSRASLSVLRPVPQPRSTTTTGGVSKPGDPSY